MYPVKVSLIVLGCVFGGTLLGMILRRVLPEDHLNPESRRVLNLALGLIGTVSGIALGLLVATAAGEYNSQKSALTEISAKFVLVDRLLADYGTEAKESRELLRNYVSRMLDQIWPENGSGHALLDPYATHAENVFDAVQQLSPANDTQRTLKGQIVSLGVSIGQSRWMMYEQGSVPFPWPFLSVVVFWFTIVFISFGVNAPRNATVVVGLFLCALAVAGAVFLILELYSPFQGWLQISSTPLRSALAQLGK